ncbi:hypothetical protein HU200_038814 [Digitaria exilis]|uniref:Uncharacterized protein n=1 Tax=Digitaria exilis TaxID=1010633 RepID=A0A835BBV5_9POAL|nr:hypothetical protein HU200_038814 [Digitaria exilis]
MALQGLCWVPSLCLQEAPHRTSSSNMPAAAHGLADTGNSRSAGIPIRDTVTGAMYHTHKTEARREGANKMPRMIRPSPVAMGAGWVAHFSLSGGLCIVRLGRFALSPSVSGEGEQKETAAQLVAAACHGAKRTNGHGLVSGGE